MYDHDYKNYPELTNTELEVLQFTSPHPQITEDFEATVVKVHDGDTVTLKVDFRDFEFPLRLLNLNAPELNEEGGKESRDWLSSRLLNKRVMVLVDRYNRVGKYGRLLGQILVDGININEVLVMSGYAKPFERRYEGKIIDFNKYIMEGAFA